MNAAEVRALVVDALLVIAPGSEVDDLDEQASLREQLDLDSLDFLAYVEQLSQRSGREVREVDYPTVDTLRGCVEFFQTAAVS